MKTAEIKEILLNTKVEQLPEVIALYESDERAAVQSLLKSAGNRYKAYLSELERTEQMKKFEYKYADYEYICGIDEVGRGPLAGPVMAAAVILPKDCKILYINDSKQLSSKKREELYELITKEAVAWAVGVRDEKRIDEINILNATYEAMQDAVHSLSVTPDILLNDAVKIPNLPMKQVPIVKGDAQSISIAAASIVAKVTRDRFMEEMDLKYPGYGFSGNKGYGSKEHIEAIKAMGPCEIHRRSFIGNFI